MALVDSPASHPLGPPGLSGNDLTVDLMLRQPTRVTRYISDITLQSFITDEIFASAGGVSGGAVLYDQASINELYLARDVQRVEPGKEFPILTAQRNAPQLASVEKWGGKIFITDEARDRNDQVLLANELRQLGNTIVRKVDQRTVAELEASISATSQTATGNDWNDVVVGGSNQSNASEFPAADFAAIQLLAEQDELGVKYDLWLVNPAQYAQFQVIYGSAAQAVLQANGIRMRASNRVAAGTAYVVASKQVGEMKVEKPLGTESWREEKTERTWIQASVRPVVYVTNPYAVVKVSGLAG